MFYLTERDAVILRAMIDDWKRRPRRQVNREVVEPHQYAPEVYVAKAEMGIPGMVEESGTGTGSEFGTPGSAECQLFRLDWFGDLEKMSFQTKLVHNLGDAVPPGSWLIVLRDKLGTWWAQGIVATDAGTGTGTSDDELTGGEAACDLVKLKLTDCIIAIGPHNSVLLRPTGTGTWSSAVNTGTAHDCLQYSNGLCGIVEAQWNSTTGFLDLYLDGLILANCLNGCYSGGPLTGHGPSGTDATDPCESETFEVCLSCVCCPPAEWTEEGWYCVDVGGTYVPLFLSMEDACGEVICSGPHSSYLVAAAACSVCNATGTGTGTVPGGGGPIEASCCPSLCGLIPPMWTLSASGFSGSAICDALNGEWTLHLVTNETNNCVWETEELDGIGNPMWSFIISSDGEICSASLAGSLELDGTEVYGTTNPDCTGPLVLPEATPPTCATTPSDLTLVPAF